MGIFPQSYVEVCEFSNDDSMMLSDGFCYRLFLSFLVSFSYFLSQRRPSQRKVSQCRCWSTARQWPASTSVGTLWWKCLLERLEREYLQLCTLVPLLKGSAYSHDVRNPTSDHREKGSRSFAEWMKTGMRAKSQAPIVRASFPSPTWKCCEDPVSKMAWSSWTLLPALLHSAASTPLLR